MAEKEKTVHQFDKNSNDAIVVRLATYKGRVYCDCRTWYRDDAGDLKPTKKGITFGPDLIPEMEKALAALKAGLKEFGVDNPDDVEF